MYLEHFKFRELPFSLTPNLEFFCNLQGHQGALNTLLFALRSGEGFIKIIGEVGSGKTLLCRKLLDSLESEFVTAYIPNPDLNPIELRRAVLRELGVKPSQLQDQHELHEAINDTLLSLHQSGKIVVLIIDESQALSLESLEALRLLTNLETEKSKLIQVVLFGQPELDGQLNQPRLRQLKQRISASYYLPLLSKEDLDQYIYHRLCVAGHTMGSLFSKKARLLLYRASHGIPRIVNILCHKALLVAYGKGLSQVNDKVMQIAILDTEVAEYPKTYLWLLLSGIGLLILSVLALYFYEGII